LPRILLSVARGPLVWAAFAWATWLAATKLAVALTESHAPPWVTVPYIGCLATTLVAWLGGVISVAAQLFAPRKSPRTVLYSVLAALLLASLAVRITLLFVRFS